MRNRFPAPSTSLTEPLRAKSRRRREDLGRLADASVHASRRNDLLPRLALEYIAIANLRPSPRKLRKLDPAHVREVANAISALGFCDPLLIGKEGLLLDGEVRYEAAKLLGLQTVPCVRIEHLNEQEQRLLRLAANRLGEKGSWSLDTLKIEFEELILADAPIEITGFSIGEIDHVVDSEVEGVEQGPLAPESDAPPIAKFGDLFQLGLHRVICGDTRDPEVLNRLMDGDEPARMVFTDPPYNVPHRRPRHGRRAS